MPETLSQPGTAVLCLQSGTVPVAGWPPHAAMPITDEPWAGREPAARPHAGAPKRARKRAFSRACPVRQGLNALADGASSGGKGEPWRRVHVKVLDSPRESRFPIESAWK